ncbi:MAG: hypothetical protein ACTSV2_14615 [Candidatus Thorarchaeota archaeon]
MSKDPRSPREQKLGYPPSPARVISRCTKYLCGAPNELLFDFVVDKLLDYLGNPDLTEEQILKDIASIPGSNSAPTMHLKSMKHWPKSDFAPLGGKPLDVKVAKKLVKSKLKNWAAVMRLKGMGIETFFTLFRLSLTKHIQANGESLVCFLWADGNPIEGKYFQVQHTSPNAEPVHVKIRTGIPYNVETKELFIFPLQGKYSVRTAYPHVDFIDDDEIYTSEHLRVEPAQPVSNPFTGSEFSVRVKSSSRVQRVTYVTNGLRVYCNPRFKKLVLVKQTPGYKAGFPPPMYDSQGNKIEANSSKKFAFKKHEELEFSGLGFKRASDTMSVTFADIRPGRYKVLAYADDETCVTTVNNLIVDERQLEETSLVHTFELDRVDHPALHSAHLQGDIIRQQDVKNQSSGSFAIANILNYWAPLAFNPRQHNGTWIMKKFGTELKGHKGKKKPRLGTIEHATMSFGLSHQSYTAIAADRETSLQMLKRWICAGIPVIVCCDEYLGRKDGGKQYKVLVGYDDSAQLRYHRSTGPSGLHAGAVYFINSSKRGLQEGGKEDNESEVIPPMFRECHPDYERTPIGNDVDAYIIFWEKWKECSEPSGRKLWFLPVYPVEWDKLAKFGKRISKK